MIVLLLLSIVHISCAAVLPLMQNIMDPQLIAIDDVQGFLYEVPEYEDPLMIEHQLSSIGAMPIFTLLEAAKKRGNPKIDDVPEKMKTVETRKTLEEIISRLQVVKSKLERGSGNIHKDLERVAESLKTLEKTSRPDMRQMLSSLQSVMTRARPIMMPHILEQITTSAPDSSENSSPFEKPSALERQSLNVRVISPSKPEFPEKHEFQNSFSSAQSESDENSEGAKSFEEKSVEEKFKEDKSMEEKAEEEKSVEEKEEKSMEKNVKEDKYMEEKVKKEKSSEDKSKSWESVEISKERYEVTKSPYELNIKEKKNANFEGDDILATYKAKVTWKTAGII